MFEAVYIASTKNTLVYEYRAALHAPGFATLLATLRAKGAGSLVEINADYFVCSLPTNNLTLYLLCSHTHNPLLAPVFLERLVAVMEEYFGAPLVPTKVTAHTDTLTLLLHEMVEDGVPNVTDANKLRELVLLGNLLLKLLRTSNQLAAAAATKLLASLSKTPATSDTDAIPWRKANVRYTNNEMFVDVVETVNVVLRPRAQKQPAALDLAFYSTTTAPQRLAPVTGAICGQVDFVSHISGVPQLQIMLNLAETYLGAVQLHRCIERGPWHKLRTLLFVPPDGPSTLMTYQVDLDALPDKTHMAMLGLVQFDCQQAMGVHQNEFELRVVTQKHHAVARIDSLLVQVFAYELGERAGANSVSGMRALRVTDGDFRYQGEGVGEWTIKNLGTGALPVLRGIISLGSSHSREHSVSPDSDDLIAMDTRPVAPLYYKVSFSYKGAVPSGLRVDSLKVVAAKGLGDSVKPYKGVKYLTKTGNYDIRL